MTRIPTPGEVWIGLAEVEQRPGAGVLMDENKAFANVLAVAVSEAGFREQIARAFETLGFDLKRLDDPEPMRDRLARASVDAELVALARDVERDGQPRFGTFHTWTTED